MCNVTEIWNARNLQRGLRRHWVRFGDEMVISGDLVISIRDIKLVAAVRAVEGARVLIEFGVPHGDRTRVALQG